MKNIFKGFITEEVGATAVEYAVLIALIIAICIIVIAAIGREVNAGFSKLNSRLTSAS